MTFEEIKAAYRALPDPSTADAIAELQTRLLATVAPMNVDLKRLEADAGATHEPEIKRTLARRNAFEVFTQIEILDEIDRDLSRKLTQAHERDAVEVAQLEAVTLNATTNELLYRAGPELKGAINTIERICNELSDRHSKVQANRRAGGGALWRGADEHALSNAITAIERLRSLVK